MVETQSHSHVFSGKANERYEEFGRKLAPLASGGETSKHRHWRAPFVDEVPAALLHCSALHLCSRVCAAVLWKRIMTVTVGGYFVTLGGHAVFSSLSVCGRFYGLPAAHTYTHTSRLRVSHRGIEWFRFPIKARCKRDGRMSSSGVVAPNLPSPIGGHPPLSLSLSLFLAMKPPSPPSPCPVSPLPLSFLFFVESRYKRFLFSRENKTARECPQCGELSVGDPAATWEMRCGACGCAFCYEHGGAHMGRTCAEYVESTADGAFGARERVPFVVPFAGLDFFLPSALLPRSGCWTFCFFEG